MDLHRRGFSHLAISRELCIGVKTVRRWLRADQFPDRRSFQWAQKEGGRV
ncbi:MAG: hypothetical protein OEV51_09660 [Nitrospira sp.]|nr:hypothetical protein [Nitrospira sp.]